MTLTSEAGPIEHRGSDVELARRMAAGERTALAEAYDAHRDQVFTAAHRLVDRSAAADVVQDAFLLAFERAASYRGDAPLGAWIRRIAINVALGELRRARWLDRFRSRPAEPPQPARPVSAEAIDLDRAIAALPETLRTVFVLHAVEGYSHEEIAGMLGIGEAACRQRLHRARTRLAARLERSEET